MGNPSSNPFSEGTALDRWLHIQSCIALEYSAFELIIACLFRLSSSILRQRWSCALIEDSVLNAVTSIAPCRYFDIINNLSLPKPIETPLHHACEPRL